MYLNVTTSSDLLNSTIRVSQLVTFLKNNNIKRCAVANQNLYKLIEYRDIFKENDLIPVFALRANVDFGYTESLPMLLYAKDNEGYKNLIKISSAILNERNEKMPYKWLQPYSKGIITIIPVQEGFWMNAIKPLDYVKSIFEERLYVGIYRTGGLKKETEDNAIEIANALSIEITALHESFYLTKEKAFAYEVLRAIDKNQILTSYEALDSTKYLPVPQELKSWFADKPQWLETATAILDNCNVEFGEYKAHMPEYPLSNGETPKECLHRLAYEGLKIRLNGTMPEAYKERLEYELGIISQMGYDSYFLSVADYMAFCKRAGILTGPGRGSSASSLVAYSLYITNVDPIQYGLLFERFLNPYRVSLPDIDVDILDKRRHEVIQYIKEKYGADHVAQIITFGTLASKAVSRDVGRILGMKEPELKKISKLIEKSKQQNLEKVYELSSDLRDFVNSSKINQVWFTVACELEGLQKNTSTHSAGVVLTPEPLVNYLPLRKGNDGVYLTQWAMGEVEKEGILKVDLLGLSNLGILDDILDSLEKTYGIKPTLETIPFNDQNTFTLLQRGLTDGIFQLESAGMTEAVMEIKPTTIDDIIAVNALYRPGPMEFISTYARRKHGLEAVSYPHPILEAILKETYGIIVYQEQILRIAQVFAGFTIGEADLLRRAISKKKREILEEQQILFVNGAKQQGHDEKIATEIYQMIVKFADYGFPKSHATAYSFITYQMAYLKANFPSHFYAAQLNKAFGNVEKVKKILKEMKLQGLHPLPIDIRQSSLKNTVENKTVRLGLKNIKGISENKVLPFLQVNLQGDLFDYAQALGEKFDKEVMKKLIMAGAFDHVFGQSRNTLLASLDSAAEYSMVDEAFIFGFEKPSYIISNEKDVSYKMEIEVCGFALNNHPIELIRPAKITESIATCENGKIVKLLGYIENVKEIETKTNEKMAFVEVSDEHGSISVTVFPQLFSKVKTILQSGNIILIEGNVEVKYGKKSIKANQLAMLN